MKNKNCFILFLLSFAFGISYIYTVSEQLSKELRPLVANFFYCFYKKQGITYYQELFNRYKSDEYKIEFYTNLKKDTVLDTSRIEYIEQKAHDKAIQAIKKEHDSIREKIMVPYGSEGYAKELDRAKKYREKCYKKVLFAENQTELLYNMLDILQSIGFSKKDIYWELQEAIKDAIDIDNPGIFAFERNQILKPIINELHDYEKRKTTRTRVFLKTLEKKTSKTTTGLFDIIVNWFKGWYQ